VRGLRGITLPHSRYAPLIAPEPVHILLVEDSPDDIELTREALSDAKLANELHAVMDGEAAIAFLRGEGEHAGKPRPDLILLDLNLPKMNGQEVLAEIKADRSLKQIPVIMLTTSAAEEDVAAAYSGHVNAYVQKPVDFSAFMTAVQSLEEFWLSIVRLPAK
jgi:CheY-like chemotaxis protein